MRLLSHTFQLDLPSRDIAGFRAALARAAGFEHDIFHNHDGAGKKLHYRYPLVQYRSERRQAGIVGIGAGADAIEKWYTEHGGRLLHNGKEHQLIFENKNLCQYEIEYHGEPQSYTLIEWLPLDEVRHDYYWTLPGLIEQIQELERILAANILTFCRAVGWWLPKKFNPRITEISKPYKTGFVGNPHVAFDLVFTCDLCLPPGIGLGSGVSHGFGVCKPALKRRRKLVHKKQTPFP